MAPDQIGVLTYRADLLRVLGRHHEAVDGYNTILAAVPHDAEALYNRGKSLWALDKREEAMASYEQAWALDHPRALNELAMCRLHVADWLRADKLVDRLQTRIAEGSLVDPFVPMVFGFHPRDQLKSAGHYLRSKMPEAPKPFIHSTAIQPGKLRIAYLSADFRQHPVGVAIAELFEGHDKTRFELIGVSNGSNDASDTRARIVAAFDQFHDVTSDTDRQVAELLNDLQVHIVVALNGLTSGCRPGVLAYRPAPIQVSYLGYAGTTGAECIDYILADATALPFDQQPFFTEKIVHLPGCYHANDTTRRISPETSTRSELGLPDQGLVFCCFNQSYKIAAPVFDVWMRLLARVPDSVLWLSRTNDLAQTNLRRVAAAHGIDPDRLIFALRMDRMEDHLARQRVADLFLDTLPYNAHSTACDALFAGLPVVTCAGNAFVGRVGASMLKAAGLPELITASLQDYEDLALTLASDPTLLRRSGASSRTPAPARCSTATVSAATSRPLIKPCGTSTGAAKARAASASSQAADVTPVVSVGCSIVQVADSRRVMLDVPGVKIQPTTTVSTRVPSCKRSGLPDSAPLPSNMKMTKPSSRMLPSMPSRFTSVECLPKPKALLRFSGKTRSFRCVAPARRPAAAARATAPAWRIDRCSTQDQPAIGRRLVQLRRGAQCAQAP